jgi:hypothetical protein
LAKANLFLADDPPAKAGGNSIIFDDNALALANDAAMIILTTQAWLL